MDYVIHYSLYIIASIAVLTPLMGFMIFAPAIAKTIIIGFVVNLGTQLQDAGVFKKIGESKFLQTHDEDQSPMWLDNAAPEKHEHHIISIKTYFMVFLALIVGTIITVGVAQFHFGTWNMIIAMAVATGKAFFVLAYFMHLKYDNMLNRVIFLSAFAFLALLFAFSYGDIISRIAPDKGF